MPVAAANLKVIANSSVRAESITPAELRSIYLEETRMLSDGSHVEPVLERGGSAHQALLKQYLGRDAESLQDYYRALVFTGRGSMPKTLGSDTEVVEYVARTRGAIGYVSEDTASDGVKTLAIVDQEKHERKLLTRVDPDYPVTLREHQIGGLVRLRVTIAASGSVEDVQVLGGNPILGEAAAIAVRKWSWAPGHASTSQEVVVPFDPSH
jgi:TonB family protein